MIIHEFHQLFHKTQPFFGVVGYFQVVEQISHSHYAESDFPRGHRHFLDFRQRILIDVNDVIKQKNRRFHRFRQFIPGKALFAVRVLPDKTPNVDGTEIAAFVRVKKDFAAGVGGNDRPEVFAERIVLVDAVVENDSRFGRFPRLISDKVKKFSRINVADDFSRARINQRIRLIFSVVLKKIRHHQDGDVEILERQIALFGFDEFFNVRMIGV